MSKIDKVFRYAEQYAAEQYTDTGDMIKKEIESGKAELSALRARVQELENELSDEEQSRLAAQAYQEQAEARVEARVEALEAALKKIAAMKKYKLNAGETIHEAYYKCYTVAESALKA